MKNLRITKIITALIIIIWVPSSFAASSPHLKITIKSDKTQVNFTYFSATRVRIEACQDSHNCKDFGSIPEEEAAINKQSDNELFRELSEDFEKKRPLTEKKNIHFMLMSMRASLENVSPFALLDAMTVEPVSRQELIVPIVTVATLSMQSDYLNNKHDIPTQIAFYAYLSKLKIVKKIVYDVTGTISAHVRVEVEDKVVKELIKAVEEKFKSTNKAANESIQQN